MASNFNITLKRNNGTDYDTLYPRTIPSQVVGLLDGGGKIDYSLLPTYVVGGMKFYNTADLSAGTSGSPIELSTLWSSLVNYANQSTAAQQFGAYIIVTATGWVKDSNSVTGSVAGYSFMTPNGTGLGEEEDNSTPYQLEKGDWIVLRGLFNPATNAYVYTFAVINNTYQDATASAKGIVTLSNQTAYASLSGNDVVTEGVLKTVIDNANFAAAGHDHAGVYQPVDGDLTAIAALSGTSGLLRKTSANTWSLDTNSYSLTTHTHGSITSDGKIGSTSDLVVVTGAAGALTTQSRSGIDSRTTFPVALATAASIGGIEVGYTSTETNRAVILSGNDAYVNLPRQIPAVTLNGSSSTAPGFYAPTASGTAGQYLLSGGSGVAPSWATINKFLYDTTTGANSGDIIFDVE